MTKEQLRPIMRSIAEKQERLAIWEAASRKVLTAEVPDWQAKMHLAMEEEKKHRTKDMLSTVSEIDGFLALLEGATSDLTIPPKDEEN
jgi:hypothetical protein